MRQNSGSPVAVTMYMRYGDMMATIDSVLWHSSAKRYLARLGDAEYERALLRGDKRYYPSEYHRSLVDALNDNDEEQFKATKMLRGCDSALGI